MFNKQVGETMIPRDRLNKALLTLSFLNANKKRIRTVERYWTMEEIRVKSACIFQRYVDLRKEIRT